MTRSDAARKLRSTFLENLIDALRTLLETKHLYQSVHVKQRVTDDFAVVGEGPREVQHLVLSEHTRLVAGHWFAIETEEHLRPMALRERDPPGLYFRPPDLKVFCGRCDRREAFNLISGSDALGTDATVMESSGPSPKQLFILKYQCQSCKSTPEVFMVERNALKLTLAGRAPMEVVEVSQVIPEAVRHFYRGALLAQHVSQTLAGNFLLRTVIEQWARVITKSAGKLQEEMKADEVIDAYMDLLPSTFKDSFESMRALYSDLSADIHSARGSKDLFTRASQEIERHFEARRLHKL